MRYGIQNPWQSFTFIFMILLLWFFKSSSKKSFCSFDFHQCFEIIKEDFVHQSIHSMWLHNWIFQRWVQTRLIHSVVNWINTTSGNMACCLSGTKPSPDTILIACKYDPPQQTWRKFASKYKTLLSSTAFEKVIYSSDISALTHWGRVTHIGVSKLSIIGSDNGLSPDRRQAIIWTNAGILLIETLGTNFNEILIEIHTFSFKNIHLKMSSGKWRPFGLGLNVLTIASK